MLLNTPWTGVHFSVLETLKALCKVNSQQISSEVLLGKYSKNLLNSTPGFKLNFQPVDTRNRLVRLVWEHGALPHYLSQNKKSIFHSPAYILPIRCPVPSIVTVHDLIALEFPELCQTATRHYFNHFLLPSLERSETIIVISEKVKADLMRLTPVKEKKIKVIHNGIKTNFSSFCPNELHLQRIRNLYSLPERFILFVGVLEPKKNLPFLLRAFSRLRDQKKIPQHLVIVGKNGWKTKEIYQTIDKYKLCRAVHLTGFVPDADLPAIYFMADLFVFPSQYEGFGLPPLEAMASGVPVIVSNRGALPEVCGDAPILVNPDDEEALSLAMWQVCSNPVLREDMIRKGKEQARLYSWDKTAQKLMDVYEEIGKKYNLI